MSEKIVNSTRQQIKPQTVSPMIDFKQICVLFVIYWKWIAASMILCVFMAGLYLWFTPTKVSVTGKMEILDKSNKNSGLSAGMAMLNSLPMGLGSALGGSLGGSLGIDSEKEILMSNSLVRSVVKDLGLYTEYRLSKWGKNTLLYQDQPINVSLDAAHVEWMDSELPLYFHQILLEIEKNDTGYKVETLVKENKKKTELPAQTFASLPATIKTEAGILTITENKLTEKQAKTYKDGYKLKVAITPPSEVADGFIARLSAEPPSKKVSNILNITLSDQNVLRAIDFVDNLVVAYNRRANDEKNEEALKTDEFVNARLSKIDSELGSSDAAWENSKKNFQITEPEIDAQEVMEKKSYYEGKLVEIGTELQLHDYLSEYVNNPENMFELIPVGIAGGMGSVGSDGGSGESASSNSSLIAQHNSLVKQRKELLRSMSDKAPQIQRLTESIKDLRSTLLTSMKRDRQNIIMKRNAVEREYSKYMGRVGTAPKMERVLTEIGRQREIKQGVYLLMLQKREETAMELANTTDKGRMIDETSFVKGSNKPQKKMVLIVAVFMGFIIPLGVLYVLQIFKTKIETPSELKKQVKQSVIGEVTLDQNDEAIRSLRTNLLLNLKSEQKVVMLVSEAAGDGKTYLSKRLTDSLLAIGKKALYMDIDLRSKNTVLHPADFLASSDFLKQMNEAKADNDYVIIDTPAIGEFNDVYQIAQFADATLFVVKLGSTDKAFLDKIKDKELPQMTYVINAIDMAKKINKFYFKK